MDSDEYSTETTDEGKRKREAKEREEEFEASEGPEGFEGFKRSRKLVRTPVKRGAKNEDKLDKLISMMENLTTEVHQLGKEQQEYRKEMEIMKKENETIRIENESIKKENAELKVEVRSLSKRMDWIEKVKRENNVVVTGLTFGTNDKKIIKEQVENFMKDNLALNVNIKDTHKLSLKSCLVELSNREEKMKVMKNKGRLRELKDIKVFIDNDCTKAEREIQSQIRKIAQEEREKGKHVKTGYQKLIIEGILYKWDKEKGKLEQQDDKGVLNNDPKN